MFEVVFQPLLQAGPTSEHPPQLQPRLASLPRLGVHTAVDLGRVGNTQESKRCWPQVNRVEPNSPALKWQEQDFREHQAVAVSKGSEPVLQPALTTTATARISLPSLPLCEKAEGGTEMEHGEMNN